MQAKLFFTRGVIAIVWAVAFGTVSGAITTATTVLLVLYPVLDLVSSLIDARDQVGSARRLLRANATVSAIVAIALGIAASTGDKADVLAVFGAWALLSGLGQLAVALRRRAKFGWQLPMVLAGGVSALLGVVFVAMAAAGNPRLTTLAVYAGTGGIDFIIQSWLLHRRLNRTVPTGDLPALQHTALR